MPLAGQVKYPSSVAIENCYGPHSCYPTKQMQLLLHLDNGMVTNGSLDLAGSNFFELFPNT